jgi:hypothetical protein
MFHKNHGIERVLAFFFFSFPPSPVSNGVTQYTRRRQQNRKEMEEAQHASRKKKVEMLYGNGK